MAMLVKPDLALNRHQQLAAEPTWDRCATKRQYRSRKAALAEKGDFLRGFRKSQSTHDPAALQAYHCARHHCWHLGNPMPLT